MKQRKTNKREEEKRRGINKMEQIFANHQSPWEQTKTKRQKDHRREQEEEKEEEEGEKQRKEGNRNKEINIGI